MEKTCPCGKQFYCIPALVERKKYCSKKCFYKYRKVPIWNKDLKGIHLSPKSEFKKGFTPWNKGLAGKGICNPTSGSIKKGERRGITTEFTTKRTLGERNVKWKGDMVGYNALHTWVHRILGKANKCTAFDCLKKSKRFEWANKSGDYKRDANDWLQLCKVCHAKYDRESWGNATKLWKLNKK